MFSSYLIELYASNWWDINWMVMQISTSIYRSQHQSMSFRYRYRRENNCVSTYESPEEVPVGAIGRYTLRIRKWWCSHAVWWKMAGSSEVTGMKCMDWFSPGRLPRNWHRQQVMDYRARPFREFSWHVRALKTLLVSLALMLRTSLWRILLTRSLSISPSLYLSLPSCSCQDFSCLH